LIWVRRVDSESFQVPVTAEGIRTLLNVIGVWPSHPAWPKWAMVPYLLFANLVSMGLAALLSFSDHVLYASYQLAPRLWSISALGDQSAAGAIMWVPGSIPFLIPAIGVGMHALDTRRAYSARPVLRPLTPRPLRQWDLLRTSLLGPMLRYRHFRRVAQVAMLLLAAIMMFDGFFGSEVAPMNLAAVLPWTYWRGLAVIALLMAGNLFCMACPITLPRDLARKFVSPRFRWPHRLRSKWIAVGLFAFYLWAYEAFAIWNSPVMTAWIIVGYFVAAFVVDMLFKGASFCKYICPIGQFHFVHSLLSPLEVKVREVEVCGSCTTYDCTRGNGRQRGCEMQLFQPRKRGNFDCTFCLDCVQACPQQNVGILRVAPAQHLIEDRHASGIGRLGRRPDVAALALILAFGAFVNAAGMTGPVMMWMHHWHPRLGSMITAVTLLYAAGLLVVPAMLAAACGWASHLGVKASWTHLTGSFTLALIPIGFSMWFAHFSNHLFAMPPWIPSLEIVSWTLVCR
jgi:polyferredoxin